MECLDGHTKHTSPCFEDGCQVRFGAIPRDWGNEILEPCKVSRGEKFRFVELPWVTRYQHWWSRVLAENIGNDRGPERRGIVAEHRVTHDKPKKGDCEDERKDGFQKGALALPKLISVKALRSERGCHGSAIKYLCKKRPIW